jgi:hypothetical protein
MLIILIIHFRWAQGYNGSPVKYIDKDVISYQCGSNVKFVAEDGTESVFNFKGNGIGPFAVLYPHTLMIKVNTLKCYQFFEGRVCIDANLWIQTLF